MYSSTFNKLRDKIEIFQREKIRREKERFMEENDTISRKRHTIKKKEILALQKQVQEEERLKKLKTEEKRKQMVDANNPLNLTGHLLNQIMS